MKEIQLKTILATSLIAGSLTVAANAASVSTDATPGSWKIAKKSKDGKNCKKGENCKGCGEKGCGEKGCGGDKAAEKGDEHKSH